MINMLTFALVKDWRQVINNSSSHKKPTTSATLTVRPTSVVPLLLDKTKHLYGYRGHSQQNNNYEETISYLGAVNGSRDSC